LRDEFSVSKNSPTQTVSPYLFVFLGASNLARGYSALAKCLTRCLVPHPVEFLRAMGPGRGYCAKGGVFNITYPPIGSCGILQSARERAEKSRKVVALITDIGNDIMYGVSLKEITACLASLFQELDALGAEVFVHPIPLDLSDDVTERQFRILRWIFYPKSNIGYEEAKEVVDAVNDFLRDKAVGRVHLLPSLKDCTGTDKIHYSVFHSHRAWSRVAAEIFSILSIQKAQKISWLSTIASLFANMGRLVFCDMIPVLKKSPETF
jgi:hypothetical protein